MALGVVGVLLGALLITVPIAHIRLAGTEVLLPAYAAAVLLVDLITSVLLLALYSLQQSRAVLILAIGYLFSGLMAAPWALTFPGVFDVFGLNAGIQSTATLAALDRVGFPLFVLGYVLLKDRSPGVETRALIHGEILGSVLAVIAIVCGLSWLIISNDDALPRLMTDTEEVADLWRYVPAVAVVLYLAALALLLARRSSVLDLWLMVVLCALLIEIVLLSYVSFGIRLSAGWWAGRIYGLVSASIVLLVLLSETTTLYARLARSIYAERLSRESRLAAMEAMSASIAHEITQPVASMVTNADAGLNWLGKTQPDISQAQAAFNRIVSDGHRVGGVVKSIRTMFKKDARERMALDLNSVVQNVLRRSQDDAQINRVSIETKRDQSAVLVSGNPIQLEQVVLNLVANAIDAMKVVSDKRRLLRVTCLAQDPGEVVVSVEDSGPGIDSEHKDRIFEPFFTTKSDGMGMGLMVSRSIIEDHGGRLWTTDNVPQGSIFCFALPRCDERDDPIGGPTG